MQGLVAHAALTIDAPRAKVWDALVTPEKIKKYMAVTDVLSEWRAGSSIVWKSEWLGNPSSCEGRPCGSSLRATLNTRIPARSSTRPPHLIRRGTFTA